MASVPLTLTPRSSRLQVLLSTLSKLQLDMPGPLKTFNSFPRLPIELRINIWKIAGQNEPRTINLHFRISEDHSQPEASRLLMACKESRNEALTIYTPCKERIRTFGSNRTMSRIVYINFAIDTFFFTSEDLCAKSIHNFEISTLNSIKYLMFPLGDGWFGSELEAAELVYWTSLAGTGLRKLVYLAEAPYHYDPENHHYILDWAPQFRVREVLERGLPDTLSEELARNQGEDWFINRCVNFANRTGTERCKRLKDLKFHVTWKEYRELELDPTSAIQNMEPLGLLDKDSQEGWVY